MVAKFIQLIVDKFGYLIFYNHTPVNNKIKQFLKYQNNCIFLFCNYNSMNFYF